MEMPQSILELACDYLMAAPLAAGFFALDAQARDILSLALVRRCDRRSAMPCASWRARASAQRCRAACWQRNHMLDTRQLRRLLRRVPELDPEEAVHRQVRHLIYLRRMTHEIVQRMVERDPAAMPWLRQQRTAIASELAQAAQAEESESAGESADESELESEPAAESELAGEPAAEFELAGEPAAESDLEG